MTIIESPAALWRHLCSSAGLELRLKGGGLGRDSDVEDSLRLALGVPANAKSLTEWLDFDAALARPTVSIERLLIEALKSQVGFSRMMRDISDLLIDAQATNAYKLLRVKFRFEGLFDPIVATLEEFREAVKQTSHVLESRPALPSHAQLWKINDLLNEIAGRVRPKSYPTFPAVPKYVPTGQKALDIELGRLTQLVSEVIAHWKQHGETRADVCKAAVRLPNDSSNEVLCKQLFAASDYWDITTLAAVRLIASRAQTEAIPAASVQRLSDVLSELPLKKVWVQKTTKELLDVLRLPVWKHRHELYSVWVGTRMLKVVRRCASEVHFLPEDGVLSFEFGGSRLATYNSRGKQHDVWAELRSALLGKSPKRKREIQPDFRVLRVDLSKSANAQTIYVLECKHYLRASTRNFSQAANDYARSCQDAVVHVVNHGVTDESRLLAAVNPTLRIRARFLGNATPDDEASISSLDDAIQDALFPASSVNSFPACSATEQKSTLLGLEGYARLIWDDSLEDMDLALRIVGSQGEVIESVDYTRKGAIDAPPFARFEEDVRQGPGQERIDIGAWRFARYQLVATNYSKSGRMNAKSLSCTIVTADELLELRCPDGLDSFEWKIAELCVDNGRVVVTPCDRPET